MDRGGDAVANKPPSFLNGTEKPVWAVTVSGAAGAVKIASRLKRPVSQSTCKGFLNLGILGKIWLST